MGKKADLDNSEKIQLKTINDRFGFEQDIQDFGNNLKRLDWKEKHQFFNACFFIIGSEDLKTNYCESVKNVLLFTSIEALMGKKDYIDFNEWLVTKEKIKGKDERDNIIEEISQDNFTIKIRDLFKVYIKNYGILEHVRKFFRDFISLKDKKQIIQSFNEQKDNKIFAPKCFISKNICFEYEYLPNYEPLDCIKEQKKGCILYKSEKDIDDILNRTISALYDIFRNKIIHEGNRSHILSSFRMEDAICCGNSLLLSYTKNNKKVLVRIEDGLNIDKFREVVIGGFRKYYNDVIKNKNESQTSNTR